MRIVACLKLIYFLEYTNFEKEIKMNMKQKFFSDQIKEQQAPRTEAQITALLPATANR